MSPDAPGWQDAWSQALSDLEMDVDGAEQLLRAVHAGRDLPPSGLVLESRWEPPRGLGALPRPLVERATNLLARQQEVSRRLAEATHANRRHARAAIALREGAPAVPVYLDMAL